MNEIAERLNPRNEEALGLANEIIVRSPVVAFVWQNAEGWPVEFASENVTRLFGWTAQDFVSGQVLYSSVVHPDDLERVAAEVARSSADPTAKTVEHTPYRIIRRDGETRWVEDMTFIRRAEDGEVIAYEGILVDITEHKQIEESLRFYLLTLNQIEDRITVTDLDGYITYVNDAECRMFQRSREQLIGQHVSIYGEDSSTGATQAEIIRKTRQEGAWRGEVTNFRPDGREVVLDCRTHVVRDDAGQPIALCGISTDVTERRRAEQALRESEKRFRDLVSSVPGAVYQFVRRPNGAIEVPFISNGANLLFDRPVEELLEPSLLFDDVHPDDLSGLWASIEESARMMSPWQREYRIVTKGGEMKWLRGVSNPRILSDGTICWIGVLLDVTQQKLAEAALQESEEKYRFLVEHAGEVILVAQDGRFRFVNNKVFDLLGYTPEELEEKPFIDYVHPEDRKMVAERHQRRLKGEDPPDFYAFRIVDKAGQTKWTEISTVLIEWEGKPATLNFLTNITDRKRVEEALRTSEERYRSLVEQSLQGVVIAQDNPMRLWFASRPMQAISGYSPQELTSFGPEQLAGLIHPEDRETFFRNFRARLTGQAVPARHEYRLIHKNGETRWVEIYSTRIRHEGRPATQTVFLDITERKQAEQALQESERQKELILNATAEMVAYYDTDLRVIWANRASAASVGKSTEELVGLHCYQIWHQSDEPCADCPVLKARDVKAPRQSEQQTPDGRYWFIRGYPILDEEEQVVALVEFGQEITSRKQAEEERDQLEKQFHQAQKLESIGRLAGGVAHDFNNILTVIIGHTEMALAQVDPAQPLFADLEEIRKAAERSADLTRQLLAFARKQTIAPELLDLNETVEGMLKMLRRLIGEQIELTWKPATALWTVRMDPGQVDQILANLCINARDAIAGTGKVTIETEKVVIEEAYCATHVGFEPGQYVMLAVSDDGCGMDKETLENIFEPFFTTKEVDQGTGLGLATVYGIVKQNNGFINVYSEPGQGTTFKIYLPRHVAKTEPMENESPAVPAAQGQETILLVEDEPAILNMGQLMLESFGYQVLVASGPGEAVRIAKEHTGEIDLLITDVVMPNMNGRELAESLISLHPGLRSLFMSGYTANVIAHHGVLKEGINFIQKPFSRQALAATVRQVLDSK